VLGTDYGRGVTLNQPFTRFLVLTDAENKYRDARERQRQRRELLTAITGGGMTRPGYWPMPRSRGGRDRRGPAGGPAGRPATDPTMHVRLCGKARETLPTISTMPGMVGYS
jgi:hypothetical protein